MLTPKPQLVSSPRWGFGFGAALRPEGRQSCLKWIIRRGRASPMRSPPLSGGGAPSGHRESATPSRKTPQFVELKCLNFSKVEAECTHMSITVKILVRFLAIGFAAAGAFGVVTFALNNNWL
jgi:hypothetical protein